MNKTQLCVIIGSLPIFLSSCTVGRSSEQVSPDSDKSEVSFFTSENSNNQTSSSNQIPVVQSLIYEAPTNSLLPVLEEGEVKAIDDAVERIKNGGDYDSKNSLYCPISMAIAQQITSDQYSVAKSLTDKFNIDMESFSAESKNAQTFPESYGLSESYKEHLHQNGISVFQGPYDEMKEELRKFLGMGVELDLGFPNAINYFAMSDSFALPWEGKQAKWNGKELMYAHGTAQMAYKESEVGYGVRFVINQTTMTFSWPKEGHELSELSLDELFASDFSNHPIHLYAPTFSIKSDFELKTGTLSEKQKAEFEFGGRGVRGKAVTVTTNPIANFVTEEFDLWVDRPFHFACMLTGTPLFIGSVLDL